MLDGQKTYTLQLHRQLIHQLQDDPTYAQSPIRQRVTLLFQQFLSSGRSNAFKGVQGSAKGWLRAPVQGYHFYLWWRAGTPKGHHGFSPDPDHIYLRLLRHHDETSDELDFGAPEEYTTLNPLQMRDIVCYSGKDLFLESPYSKEQYAVAHSPARLRLLKGLPGTGKTTSLWLAALAAHENDRAQHILYLTLSERLIERARQFFQSLHHHTPHFCYPLHHFWAELAREDYASPFPIRDDELAGIFETAARQKNNNPLLPWQGAWATLYAELYGQVFGRYSYPFSGGKREKDGIEEARERDGLLGWGFERERYKAEREAELGRSLSKMVRVVDYLQEGYAELSHRSPLSARKTPQHQLRPIFNLFRPLFLALHALQRLRSSQPLPAKFRHVDWIVIDEIQDLTPLECRVLAAFVERLRRHRHEEATPQPKEMTLHESKLTCLLAGDEGQTARPTFFDWGEINPLFYIEGQTENFDLRDNLRSPPLITALIEESRHLYSQIPKEMRPKNTHHIPAKEENAPLPSIFLLSVPSTHQDEHFFMLLDFFSQLNDAIILSSHSVFPTGSIYWQAKKRFDQQTGRPDVFLLASDVKGLDFQWVALLDLYLEPVPENNPLALLQRRQAIDLLRIALSRPRERLVIFATEGAQGAIHQLISQLPHDERGIWRGDTPRFCAAFGDALLRDQDSQIASALQMAQKLAEASPKIALSHILTAERLLQEEEGANLFILQRVVALKTEIAYKLAIDFSLREIPLAAEHKDAFKIATQPHPQLASWKALQETQKALQADWILYTTPLERREALQALDDLLKQLSHDLLLPFPITLSDHLLTILPHLADLAEKITANRRRELLHFFQRAKAYFQQHRQEALGQIQRSHRDFALQHTHLSFQEGADRETLSLLCAHPENFPRFLRPLLNQADAINAFHRLLGHEDLSTPKGRELSNQREQFIEQLRILLQEKTKQHGKHQSTVVTTCQIALDIWFEGRKKKKPDTRWTNFSLLLEKCHTSYKEAEKDQEFFREALKKTEATSPPEDAAPPRPASLSLEDVMRKWHGRKIKAAIPQCYERHPFSTFLHHQRERIQKQLDLTALQTILLEQQNKRRERDPRLPPEREQAKIWLYEFLRLDDRALSLPEQIRHTRLETEIDALSFRNITEVLRELLALESELKSLPLSERHTQPFLLEESAPAPLFEQQLDSRFFSEARQALFRVLARIIQKRLRSGYQIIQEQTATSIKHRQIRSPHQPENLLSTLRRLYTIWPRELRILSAVLREKLQQQPFQIEASYPYLDLEHRFPYGTLEAKASRWSLAASLWFLQRLDQQGESERFFQEFYAFSYASRLYIAQQKQEEKTKHEEDLYEPERQSLYASLLEATKRFCEKSAFQALHVELSLEGQQALEDAFLATRLWKEAEQAFHEEERQQPQAKGRQREEKKRSVFDLLKDKSPHWVEEAEWGLSAFPFWHHPQRYTWTEAFTHLDEAKEAERLEHPLHREHRLLQDLRRMRRLHLQEREADGKQDQERYARLAVFFREDEISLALEALLYAPH